MKRVLMIFPLLLAANASIASEMTSSSASMTRVHISDMTCAEVQEVLQSSRKALLQWHSKSGMLRYGMYIPKDGWCRNQQYKSRTAVGTTDMKSPHACPVMQCNNFSRPPSR